MLKRQWSGQQEGPGDHVERKQGDTIKEFQLAAMKKQLALVGGSEDSPFVFVVTTRSFAGDRAASSEGAGKQGSALAPTSQHRSTRVGLRPFA